MEAAARNPRGRHGGRERGTRPHRASLRARGGELASRSGRGRQDAGGGLGGRRRTRRIAAPQLSTAAPAGCRAPASRGEALRRALRTVGPRWPPWGPSRAPHARRGPGGGVRRDLGLVVGGSPEGPPLSIFCPHGKKNYLLAALSRASRGPLGGLSWPSPCPRSALPLLTLLFDFGVTR